MSPDELDFFFIGLASGVLTSILTLYVAALWRRKK
jgi:hypothetical protein